MQTLQRRTRPMFQRIESLEEEKVQSHCLTVHHTSFALNTIVAVDIIQDRIIMLSRNIEIMIIIIVYIIWFYLENAGILFGYNHVAANHVP